MSVDVVTATGQIVEGISDPQQVLRVINEGGEILTPDHRGFYQRVNQGGSFFVVDGGQWIPLAEFVSGPTLMVVDDDTFQGGPSDALLPPYTGAPNPDNAGAAIGPQIWTTTSSASALQPGPLHLTNGVEIAVETTIEGITRRLESGFHPIRPDGTAAFVQQFLGGYLIDGNPLNVVLGGPWLPEQIEAITPAIQAGVVPSPSIQPSEVFTLSSESEGFAQFALPATGLAAALLLWRWAKRRKGN